MDNCRRFVLNPAIGHLCLVVQCPICMKILCLMKEVKIFSWGKIPTPSLVSAFFFHCHSSPSLGIVTWKFFLCTMDMRNVVGRLSCTYGR